MIFCDLSTPKEDGFDVYNDVRDKLVAKGIPKEEVQFIHDADTETKKAELFGKVRNGTVRVLMGSTQKMGAGTNVQTRLIALHHLDCPWRPADIAQRNGRMVRQGNLNKEVSIFIYVTESTFDSYSWQLVENKQKFISQIMTSKSPARSCEDLDEAALTYAEVKALAAGNPMIKEKMDLDIQVARLRTLKAAYISQHYRLEDAIAVAFPRQIKGTEHRIRAFEQDIQTAKEHQSYDADKKLIFSIELDGKTYDKREDAGKALLGLVGAAVRVTKPVPVGHYAGFEITVEYKPLEKVFHAHLDIENAIAALPGGIGNMPVALELMVVGWMLRIVNIVVNTIVAARFIELYVYNAMASLSIATLCYQELHGIAVNFLKSYLAVALQGAVLYLVIGFYPALAGSLGTGGSITEQAWAMLGQSVILLVAVFMSGKFTKAITNAMT